MEMIRDVAYTSGGHPQQRLDVYLPRPRSVEPRGAVVYFHGGAFQYLSRRTHAHVAMRFALGGFVVFNVDYRLAPLNPAPACMEDASSALRWITAHADRFGVDPSRILVAGDSAGATIAVTATVAGSVRQRSTWARRLLEEGPSLRGCIAACGVFGVDDPAWRRSDRARAPRVREIFQTMKRRFDDPWNYSDRLELPSTDVVSILESAVPEIRALPELFAFVGTHDPVEEDTRRLASAYRARGARVTSCIYPGQRHVFHAISLGSAARDVWRKQLAFAARCLT